MRVAPVVRAFVFVALFTKPFAVTAQNKSPIQQGKADAPRVDPDNKKALSVADYARWRSIATPAISSDGKWVAWSYTQVRRDEELHIKQADGDREIVVSGGSRPAFSDDAQWVAYYVAPATTGRGGGRGGRGGAAPAPAPAPANPAPTGGRGGDGAAAAPPRRVELVNLATQMKTTWEDVANVEFSKGSGYFVVHRARQQPPPKYEGTDLIVRDLKSQGADLIKLFASAGLQNGGNQTLSDEQLAAICGEAKSLGLRTVVSSAPRLLARALIRATVSRWPPAAFARAEAASFPDMRNMPWKSWWTV